MERIPYSDGGAAVFFDFRAGFRIPPRGASGMRRPKDARSTFILYHRNAAPTSAFPFRPGESFGSGAEKAQPDARYAKATEDPDTAAAGLDSEPAGE